MQYEVNSTSGAQSHRPRKESHESSDLVAYRLCGGTIRMNLAALSCIAKSGPIGTGDRDAARGRQIVDAVSRGDAALAIWLQERNRDNARPEVRRRPAASI